MANGAHRASEARKRERERDSTRRSLCGRVRVKLFGPGTRIRKSPKATNRWVVSELAIAANWVSMQGTARSGNAAEYSSFKAKSLGRMKNGCRMSSIIFKQKKERQVLNYQTTSHVNILYKIYLAKAAAATQPEIHRDIDSGKARSRSRSIYTGSYRRRRLAVNGFCRRNTRRILCNLTQSKCK